MPDSGTKKGIFMVALCGFVGVSPSPQAIAYSMNSGAISTI
jgi:hypothetical protein